MMRGESAGFPICCKKYKGNLGKEYVAWISSLPNRVVALSELTLPAKLPFYEE
jgi:hypothetical protein